MPALPRKKGNSTPSVSLPESTTSGKTSITSSIVEGYLSCPTKAFLRASREQQSANDYADWLKAHSEAYRSAGISLLVGKHRADGTAVDAISELRSSTDRSRFVTGAITRYKNLEANIHGSECIAVGANAKAVERVPVRFVHRNILSKTDKLLLAFDAYVLSKAETCSCRSGKLVHGDDYRICKLDLSRFDAELTRTLEKLSALLSEPQPQTLILNRHCPECEFHDRCRQVATTTDDLSLLTGLPQKERTKLNAKGIFSVIQLSYTFRPRRQSKYNARKQEKYQYSLKALAIRDRKTYIAATTQLTVNGTPVYIDVEGLPDRDFYYLIGLRVECCGTTIEHSLWADNLAGEELIWRDFLSILSSIKDPVLIHFGSYETTFLRKMCARHGPPPDGSVAGEALNTTINLLSAIYARVYFPVYSNGLKEIAAYLGFRWDEPNASGLLSLVWRCGWEKSRDPDLRQRLITYNANDCAAAAVLMETLLSLNKSAHNDESSLKEKPDIVYADRLKGNPSARLGAFKSAISGFEKINASARWDYQRNQVYFRGKSSSNVSARVSRKIASPPPGKVVICTPATQCPECGSSNRKLSLPKYRTVHDLIYGRTSLRRKVVKYMFRTCRCCACGCEYGLDGRFGHANRKYGWGVLAYFIYFTIALYASQGMVLHVLNKLLGFDLAKSNMGYMKIRAANYYCVTKADILKRIVAGSVIHVDETSANIRGHRAYVWVLTNMVDAVYILSENREGGMIQDLLSDFKGVLVSDYYAVYDSVDCPQQKCLIHLMRDLNDEVFKNPFDAELHELVSQFSVVLKPIVDTVDLRGLKAYFLRKHEHSVEQFFAYLERAALQSELAIKCRQRFMKNRDKLFTFLAYDGVPWNNNNAEHAIKAFASLRNIISGPSTQKGTDEYLTLLSVCKSCEYRGVDFLDFLRSGEKDVASFSRRGRRTPSVAIQHIA